MQIKLVGKLTEDFHGHRTFWPSFRAKFCKVKIQQTFTHDILAILPIIHFLPTFFIIINVLVKQYNAKKLKEQHNLKTADLPTLPDRAGDTQKINRYGNTNLTISLIRETFNLCCVANFTNLLIRKSPLFPLISGCKCWQLWNCMSSIRQTKTVIISVFSLSSFIMNCRISFYFPETSFRTTLSSLVIFCLWISHCRHVF